jgi:hypothetical protein
VWHGHITPASGVGIRPFRTLRIALKELPVTGQGSYLPLGRYGGAGDRQTGNHHRWTAELATHLTLLVRPPPHICGQ